MLEATNLQSAQFEATACKMLQGGFKAKDSAPGQFLHPTAAKAHPWINIPKIHLGLSKDLLMFMGSMITTGFWDSGIPFFTSNYQTTPVVSLYSMHQMEDGRVFADLNRFFCVKATKASTIEAG